MYNGYKIRLLLKERNLLQKDLLEFLYSDKQKTNGSITQLERGNPTAKTLEKIADFFNVSMDVFFDREFEQKNIHPTKDTNIFLDRNTQIEALQKLIDEKERFIQYLLSQQNKSK